MKRSGLLWTLAALGLFSLGFLCGQLGPGASAQAQPEPGTRVTPVVPSLEKSPVVAATVFQTVTENEFDAFDAEKLRRTRTTVQSIALVRADGTTEIRRLPGG